jgi:hypothetical protein
MIGYTNPMTLEYLLLAVALLVGGYLLMRCLIGLKKWSDEQKDKAIEYLKRDREPEE